MKYLFRAFLIIFFLEAIACSSGKQESNQETQIPDSNLVNHEADIPKEVLEDNPRANLILGTWLQLRAEMEGHIIDGKDLGNPQRIFTKSGQMIFFSDDTDPDTVIYELKGDKLSTPLDGIEFIKHLTKDTLILESEIDGIRSQYIYSRE